MEEQGQIAPLSCTRGEAVVEEGKGWDDSSESGERCGFCAICLEKIALPEMALVKGCEHAYCVMCILRWATYRERPSCPQFQAQREEVQEDGFDELEDFLQNEYEDELDDLDESYFASRSSIRIGNRRWGDNGYVRTGRKEARPVNLQSFDDEDAGPSRTPKKKEAAKDSTGRRAKRALKREAADKAAAAKHQQHLQRLGRK